MNELGVEVVLHFYVTVESLDITFQVSCYSWIDRNGKTGTDNKLCKEILLSEESKAKAVNELS